MNIVVFGAGAIGSFFGGVLSKNNNVFLIGRKDHVEKINKNGLKIIGKTNHNAKLEAFAFVKDVFIIPDLVILAVKSYDTQQAMSLIKPIIRDNTYVMSLQNGLDNIGKIRKYVNSEKILACITTHGVVFSKPGSVEHTGVGRTIVGALNNKKTGFVKDIASNLNNCGIKTTICNEINSEIWTKAIINSSINPVTSIFCCKNRYLLNNPILEKIVERICIESTNIANSQGFNFSESDMIDKTKQVINETSENYSSMLQSVKSGKKTEIDSINGKLVEIGKKSGVDASLNEILVYSIK